MTRQRKRSWRFLEILAARTYVTDIEDSGSDYEYLWDDEAYVAGRQADYALYKAYWDEIRAKQPTMGRGLPDSSECA